MEYLFIQIGWAFEVKQCEIKLWFILLVWFDQVPTKQVRFFFFGHATFFFFLLLFPSSLFKNRESVTSRETTARRWRPKKYQFQCPWCAAGALMLRLSSSRWVLQHSLQINASQISYIWGRQTVLLVIVVRLYHIYIIKHFQINNPNVTLRLSYFDGRLDLHLICIPLLMCSSQHQDLHLHWRDARLIEHTGCPVQSGARVILQNR